MEKNYSGATTAFNGSKPTVNSSMNYNSSHEMSSLPSPTSAQKDSMNTSVAELAADSKAKKEEQGCGFHLPVAVIVMIIVIITLGAVAGPLFYILHSNAVDSVNTFGSTIMNQAVDKVVSQVQDVLFLPYSLVAMTITNLPLQRALLTNNRNLRSEVDTYFFMSSVTATSEYISGVSCASYPNIFEEPPRPPTPGNLNMTFIGTYKRDNKPNAALYMDWTTGPILNQMNYSIENSAFGPSAPAFGPLNWVNALSTFEFFNAMLTRPTDRSPWTSISFNQGVMISGVNQMFFAPQYPDHPAYSCSVGFENEKGIGKLFREIKVTPNSKVIMIDTLTGKVVASSVPNTVFRTIPNARSPEQYDLTNTIDTTAQLIGKTLSDVYGNYTKIPYSLETISRQVDIGDGQTWFINTRYLAQPSNWMIIVAVPRSDFFGETDRASRKAIILASTVAAAGVIIAAVAAFLLMRPLYKLSKAMEMLTNLDFSALEGNILRERSFVGEVRNLQITFSTMCKAFASGIRRNRALAGGYNTSKQSGAQSNTAY
ncbi:hypothetical protein HDU67_004993 [Dinochytrium kinnereticum]|nr:hypothetical protein HDU67_004993 [Dinochytrium kinnereticum]